MQRNMLGIGAAVMTRSALLAALWPWTALAQPTTGPVETSHAGITPPAATVTLSDEQLRTLRIGPAGTHAFPVEETTVGSIDFDEDLEAQLTPPYQGRLLQIYVRQGDQVTRGQKLFTVDSPDLIQAEQTYIAADGVLRLSDKALERARNLYGTKSLAQKDFEQALSDQQTAEGNFTSAREALRIFGKTPSEIEALGRTRRADAELVVRSPVTGVVVTRNAAPGLFVQPGNAPAPLTVADTSIMWVLGNASENVSDIFKVGQPVMVEVSALPGRKLASRLTAVGATIDPTSRRVTLRGEIPDPTHLLRSGMFATLSITTGPPEISVAIPMNGVVREGDGTETVWVTADRRVFTRHKVRIGRSEDGLRQILGGLHEGDMVVTDGAVFLSNMLTADPS